MWIPDGVTDHLGQLPWRHSESIFCSSLPETILTSPNNAHIYHMVGMHWRGGPEGKQEAESFSESVTFGGDSAAPCWVPSPVCSQLVEKAEDREKMGRLWGAHSVVGEMK